MILLNYGLFEITEVVSVCSVRGNLYIMSVVLKKESGEFVLDKDYEINTVRLLKTENEHTHGFVEMVYTLSGRGVHKIDGEEYYVKSGDMLIINYHSCHTVTPINDLCYIDIMLKPEYINDTLKGTEDVFLVLKLPDFSDLSSSIIKDNVLLHFDGDEKKRIEFLLEWTNEEQKKRLPAADTALYSALTLLLITVFRKMAEKSNARLTLDERMLSYMKKNCSDKILISEIAAACGYTPEHFSRRFKKYTGKTPVQYILDARISRAKELLKTTEKPIETVISECGFSNRTAFFEKFSESVGITPLQYRKNQK